MTTTQVHTLPLSWDDARETRFFRITARLFSAEFCLGASVLLASNDDLTPAVSDVLSASRSTRIDAPATADSRIWPDSDLIPVRVRRTS
jgi:hypothetical protein